MGRRKRNNYNYREINEQLNKLGLEIKEIAGDGNCLFRSIADIVEGNQNRHNQIRQSVCTYMEKHRDLFSPFIEEPFEKYISNMRKDGTWGGNQEIQAASLLYNRNFVIHQLNMPRFEIINNYHDENTIHLFYHQEGHYSSIRRIDEGSHNGKPLPILSLNLPPKNEHDWEGKIEQCTNVTNKRFINAVLKQMNGDSDETIEYIISLGDSLTDEFMETYIKDHESPDEVHDSNISYLDQPQTNKQYKEKQQDKRPLNKKQKRREMRKKKNAPKMSNEENKINPTLNILSDNNSIRV